MKGIFNTMIFIFALSCTEKEFWSNDTTFIKKSFPSIKSIDKVIWKKDIFESRSLVPSPEKSTFYGFIKLSNELNSVLGKKRNISMYSNIPKTWEVVERSTFYSIDKLSEKYSRADGTTLILYSPQLKIIYFEVKRNHSSKRRSSRRKKADESS